MTDRTTNGANTKPHPNRRAKGRCASCRRIQHLWANGLVASHASRTDRNRQCRGVGVAPSEVIENRTEG